MAEVSGFKHISVSVDTDDDVVIRAGVQQEGYDQQEQHVQYEPGVDDGTVYDIQADESVQQQPAQAAEVDKKHSDQVQTSANTKTSTTTTKKDEYHETTLDDLKSEPMSKTQKIIIVCAVAAIVVALVYYFLFMR